MKNFTKAVVGSLALSLSGLACASHLPIITFTNSTNIKGSSVKFTVLNQQGHVVYDHSVKYGRFHSGVAFAYLPKEFKHTIYIKASLGIPGHGEKTVNCTSFVNGGEAFMSGQMVTAYIQPNSPVHKFVCQAGLHF